MSIQNELTEVMPQIKTIIELYKGRNISHMLLDEIADKIEPLMPSGLWYENKLVPPSINYNKEKKEITHTFYRIESPEDYFIIYS